MMATRSARIGDLKSILNIAAATVLVLAALVIVSNENPVAANAIPSCGLVNNRLSPAFEPVAYDLTLQVDETSAKKEFVGHVDIRVNYNPRDSDKSNKPSLADQLASVCRRVFACMSPDDMSRRQLLLNVGASVEILGVNMVSELSARKQSKQAANSALIDSNNFILIDDLCHDPQSELLRISLGRQLADGETVSLSIDFKTKIEEEKPRGARAGLGAKKSSSPSAFEYVTNFYPAAARSTFPCFDQPNLKATFKFKLIHHKDVSAISNMPVESIEPIETGQRPGELVATRFSRSPRMSTSAVGFALGQYHETGKCLAEGRSRAVEVRAHSPVGDESSAKFQLDLVCKAIVMIEQYFNSPFPLEKLDLVAVPIQQQQKQQQELVQGNWGLLFLSGQKILSEELGSPESSRIHLKVRLVRSIVQALLRHWMGNLVSASWWNDQWIFEGFTRWKSYSMVGELFASNNGGGDQDDETLAAYQFDLDFALNVQSVTLDEQTEPLVRPIREVEEQDLTVEQEVELFDWNKASGLFQMLSNSLAESLVRDTLVRFTDLNKFNASNTDAFVGLLTRFNGLQYLNALLKSWLNLPGIPVIHLKRTSKQEFSLRQKRLETHETVNGKDQIWTVQLTAEFHDRQSGRRELQKLLMDKREMQFKAPVWFDPFNSNHFLKFNRNFSDLYRIDYDPELLDKLRAMLELSITDRKEAAILQPVDRLNVIDDLRALYECGLADADKLIGAARWYLRETNGGVLSGLVRVVSSLGKESKKKSQIKQLVVDLFGHLLDEYRGSGEAGEASRDIVDMKGHEEALRTLVAFEHQPTIDEALRVFGANDASRWPREATYLAVINHGTDEQFESLLSRLREKYKSTNERRLVLSGLREGGYIKNMARKAKLFGGTTR